MLNLFDDLFNISLTDKTLGSESKENENKKLESQKEQNEDEDYKNENEDKNESEAENEIDDEIIKILLYMNILKKGSCPNTI